MPRRMAECASRFSALRLLLEEGVHFSMSIKPQFYLSPDKPSEPRNAPAAPPRRQTARNPLSQGPAPGRYELQVLVSSHFGAGYALGPLAHSTFNCSADPP
jgi:hypothetical protein